MSSRVGANVRTTSFNDVDAAVALMGQDPVGAAAFVERELGPVKALGARGERLIETLEVFLKHGQRVANASAVSGRHRDTVRRHLCEVEELLGCTIEERSADLLWAIRLRRALSRPENPAPRRGLSDRGAWT